MQLTPVFNPAGVVTYWKEPTLSGNPVRDWPRKALNTSTGCRYQLARDQYSPLATGNDKRSTYDPRAVLARVNDNSAVAVEKDVGRLNVERTDFIWHWGLSPAAERRGYAACIWNTEVIEDYGALGPCLSA